MNMIQFGIVLKAFDQMSGVFGGAANKSMGAINRLDARVGALSSRLEKMGTRAMGDGALLTGMMQKPIEAFVAAEDAAARLNATMLKAGGVADPQFNKMIGLGKKLGASLPGSDTEYIKMLQTMQEEGIKTTAILGGLGEASAKFKVIMGDKVTADGAAKLTAQLSDALQAKESEMESVMDYAARLQGVGANADYSLGFFSKASASLSLTKKSGIGAMTEMAPIAAMAANGSMEAGSAGGTFNKLLSATLDGKKMEKANRLMAASGQRLDFVGKDGNFLGIGNFISQIEKLNKLNDTQLTAVTKELFGDDTENKQLLNILRQKGVDGYNEYAERMAEQAKLADRIKVIQGTLGNKWEAAMGGFSSNLVTLGESLSPALNSLVDIFDSANTALSGVMKEYPNLTKALSVGVAGIGGGLLVLGATAMVASTALKGLGFVLGPLAKLGGLFGKKGGAAGKAAEAAAGMAVQRVWVTNWPGSGFDAGGPDGGGGKRKPAATGRSRMSRLGGGIKTAGRFLGRNAGGLLAVGASMYQAYDTYQNAKTSKDKGAGYGGAAGSLAGGLAGAKAGALIGALGGPIGIALGGLIGGAIGTFAGQKLGAYAGGKLAAGEPTPLARTGTPPVTAPRAAGLGAPAGPVPAPVPLNPAARQQAGATPPVGKTVVPQVSLTYNPSLIIQGDPIPGTAEKFKAMLNAHRDELLRLVNQAVENKARTAY
ncbi:hypothetical protein GCM10027202_12590 [Microvirgula curvata]